VLAAALLASTALAGCQVDRLQFRNDHRLSFTAPQARSRVVAPVTVSWTMRDFTATGLDDGRDARSGVFAVFVDQAPMPVGKDLHWLVRSDRSCVRDPRCPTAKALADRGVFLTTGTTVSVDILPRVADGVGDEQHYVNVVLLDGSGQRIGESAWYLPFRSKRRSV
jgi:hypothetical protein